MNIWVLVKKNYKTFKIHKHIHTNTFYAYSENYKERIENDSLEGICEDIDRFIEENKRFNLKFLADLKNKLQQDNF
jgi:hypothetical protein